MTNLDTSAELIAAARAMRKTALSALMTTQEWRVAKAADDMMVALGEPSILPTIPGVRFEVLKPDLAHRGSVSGRISQSDAAEQVLMAAGNPMPVAALLAKLDERGVFVGGEKREINLSSALSRDDRFDSIRVDGQPMWTLARFNANAQNQQRRALQIEDDDL